LQLQEAAFCCSYSKNANEGCNRLCKGQGAVDGHDVRQGRPATAGERVSWPASPPESAPITDRPELAAPLRRTMNINQLDGTPYIIGCNLKHYNKMLMRPATDLHGYLL